MILFGEEKLYASHLVYKQPHNYQVIVELRLDPATKDRLQRSRREFPRSRFLLLLDAMEIQNIATLETVSGTILRENEAGVRQPVAEHLLITNKDFNVIYFDEVPLSLAHD